MLLTDLLWVVLDRVTPYLSMLEIEDQGSVNLHTEIFNGSLLSLENDRSLVIWNFTLWLCVDSDQVEVLPDSFEKFVEIPTEFTGNWNVVGNSIPNFELFEGDGINLVQNVDTWDVDSVSFDSVNKVIWGSVAGESNISVYKSVFFANGSDL